MRDPSTLFRYCRGLGSLRSLRGRGAWIVAAALLVGACSSADAIKVFKGDDESNTAFRVKYKTGLQGRYGDDASVPQSDRPGGLAADRQAVKDRKTAEQKAKEAAAAAPPSDQGGPPRITSVPDNPKQASGLVADRQNRRYTDQPASPVRTAVAARAPAVTDGRLIATILFSGGSSELAERDGEAIGLVADYILSNRSLVRVIGHASSQPGANSNAEHKLADFDLSLSRAEAVARMLIQRGVDARSVLLEARGDSLIQSAGTSSAGDTREQRAEIYLLN